jgi:hypothetical protein
MILDSLTSLLPVRMTASAGTLARGKPFWNTETADTACGGNAWGGTFLDTLRYLDQLGRLANTFTTGSSTRPRPQLGRDPCGRHRD